MNGYIFFSERRFCPVGNSHQHHIYREKKTENVRGSFLTRIIRTKRILLKKINLVFSNFILCAKQKATKIYIYISIIVFLRSLFNFSHLRKIESIERVREGRLILFFVLYFSSVIRSYRDYITNGDDNQKEERSDVVIVYDEYSLLNMTINVIFKLYIVHERLTDGNIHLYTYTGYFFITKYLW